MFNYRDKVRICVLGDPDNYHGYCLEDEGNVWKVLILYPQEFTCHVSPLSLQLIDRIEALLYF